MRGENEFRTFAAIPVAIRAEDSGGLGREYLAKAYLAEMVGTYLLVFIGPGSLILASSMPGLSSTDGLSLVALVFGSTVAAVMVTLGRHSGAHINPAITLANVIAGITGRRLILPYILSQLAGSLLAGLTLRLVFAGWSASASLGATKLAPGVSLPEGFGLEMLGTFVLAFSALTAASRISGPYRQAALVGSTLFLLILVLGPLTGASFNPARSVGPSVFADYFNAQEVYWFAPMVGGGLAGYLFGLIGGRAR